MRKPREVVTLFAVAETFKPEQPYVLASVQAETFHTCYKIRWPDLEPQRTYAMRAFKHYPRVPRRGNPHHLLTVPGAIEHFIANAVFEVECATERLQEARRALKWIKKVFNNQVKP